VSLVEHPARLLMGPPMALAQFRTSYPRGAWLQGGLAALGTLAAIGAWVAGARAGWFVAGIVLGSVIPFTVVVIFPTNKRLLDPALSPDAPETRQLLRRWTGLHTVRTVLGLAAAAAMAHLLAHG
jgi:Domain of unknown function (DUF1772)